MRGSSAAENVVHVPPPEIPMQPDALRVELLPRLDPVDRAHDVPHAPADHGLAEQQRGAGGGLAGGVPESALLRRVGSRRQPNAIGSIATAAMPCSAT